MNVMLISDAVFTLKKQNTIKSTFSRTKVIHSQIWRFHLFLVACQRKKKPLQIAADDIILFKLQENTKRIKKKLYSLPTFARG